MDDDRMSMSSDDESDLYEPVEAVPVPVPLIAIPAADTTSLHPDASHGKRSLEDGEGDHPDKKSRTASADKNPVYQLKSAADRFSSGLYQLIFSYLPPPTLAVVMQVCKAFRNCLDGSIPPNVGSDKESIKTISADAIWAQWRKVNIPSMPKPLQGLSEREMWKLIRGFRCEMCDKLDAQPRQPSSGDVWHGGPQMSTTRAIWPFGSRYCAECCYRSCEKDTNLLCKPVQPFMSALPYAFFTHDWHYVPTTVIKEAGQPPTGVQIAKQFLNLHADQILEQYEEAKTLGSAAVEEWSKGLAGMGKYTMADAARWEHWEIKGGLSHVHAMLPPSPPLPPQPPAQTVHVGSSLPWQQPGSGWSATSGPQIHQPQPLSMAHSSFTHLASTAGAYPHLQASPVLTGPSPFTQPGYATTPHGHVPNSYGQPPPQSVSGSQLPTQRVERNIKDAEAGKAARRKMIEDRAYSDLAILPNVLRHMESFQAAIQISVPMTENGWEVLKPRLLAQREIAQKQESEHTAQLLALQARTDAQNNTQNRRNAYTKEAKDAQEREWDEALKPQREKLSSLFDQHVHNEWRGGKSINNGNVARFAISVFNTVRKQFYSELDIQDLIAGASGYQIRYDPPDGPFLRRLTLETMKWVYDHKIRALSRDFGKEIFFCSGEGCEGNNKFYAFEGVIQHYGAKHTNNFSKGNVIVHWQTAEWPEDLPFFDPGSGPVRSHANGGFSRATTITPHIASGAFATPSLTISPYGQMHSGYSNGPFPPPLASPLGAQQPYQNGSAHLPTPQIPTQSYDRHDLSQYFKVALGGLRGSAAASPASEVSPTVPPNNTQQRRSADFSHVLHSLRHTAPNAATARMFDTDMPDFEVYQDQLKHIADTARSAWNSFSAIYGLPQSVRVFVVIHHTVSQFVARFDVELSLETFTAALTNNSLLEPLKVADGLVCHFCSLQAANGDLTTLSSLTTQPSSLASLISHFKGSHIDGGPLSLPHLRKNWSKEMIALPANSAIADLTSAPGINEEKLQFLAEAFPDVLPKRTVILKEANGKSKQKNNRRFGRKASGVKDPVDAMDTDPDGEYPLWESKKSDTRGPGYGGLSRRSQSPFGLNGQRHTPKLYDDQGDQYDPSKPALIPESGRKRGHERPRNRSDNHRSFKREHERRLSDEAADLAALIKSATEQADRAAEEENRRRGIPSTVAPTQQPTYEPVPQTHQFIPESRAESANRIRYALAPVVTDDRRIFNYANLSPTERASGSRLVEYAPQDERFTVRRSPPQTRTMREYAPEVSYASADPTTRTLSSRYVRYDEHHVRSRSRSPARPDGYPNGGVREIPRQRDYAPDARSGAMAHSPMEYRYANEPEIVYVDQHGRPIRVVQVLDDSRTRYPGDPTVEYVDRRPTVDERGAVYYDHGRPVYASAPDSRYDPRFLPPATQMVPGRDMRYE